MLPGTFSRTIPVCPPSKKANSGKRTQFSGTLYLSSCLKAGIDLPLAEEENKLNFSKMPHLMFLNVIYISWLNDIYIDIFYFHFIGVMGDGGDLFFGPMC